MLGLNARSIAKCQLSTSPADLRADSAKAGALKSVWLFQKISSSSSSSFFRLYYNLEELRLTENKNVLRPVKDAAPVVNPTPSRFWGFARARSRRYRQVPIRFAFAHRRDSGRPGTHVATFWGLFLMNELPKPQKCGFGSSKGCEKRKLIFGSFRCNVL